MNILLLGHGWDQSGTGSGQWDGWPGGDYNGVRWARAGCGDWICLGVVDTPEEGEFDREVWLRLITTSRTWASQFMRGGGGAAGESPVLDVRNS